jgi:hypothetical protein
MIGSALRQVELGEDAADVLLDRVASALLWPHDHVDALRLEQPRTIGR